MDPALCLVAVVSVSGTYYCMGCANAFPELEADLRSAFDPDARATRCTVHCPVCGSDELEDAYRCVECGEFFASSLLEDDLCLTCLPIVDKREGCKLPW